MVNSNYFSCIEWELFVCMSDMQHAHVLLFCDLYREKHATFEFNLFLQFNLDRDAVLRELNTTCHVPAQGMENVGSALWPTDDKWPGEMTNRLWSHAAVPGFPLLRPHRLPTAVRHCFRQMWNTTGKNGVLWAQGGSCN